MAPPRTQQRTVTLTRETMNILQEFCEASGLSPRDALSVMVREVARDHGLIPDSGGSPASPSRSKREPPQRAEPTKRRRGQIIPQGEDKWVVRVFVGRNEKGKRKYVSRTIHGCRKEAEAALQRALGRAIVPSYMRRSSLWSEIWGE